MTLPAIGAEGYHAGVARIDVTPERPLPLFGYDPELGPSEGVDDRLQARALVLREATGVLSVLVSVDASAMPAAVREGVCRRVRPRLGIYRPRIAICATGSTSAPVLSGGGAERLSLTPEQREAVSQYGSQLAEKIATAVEEAAAALQPAELSVASVEVDAGCRPTGDSGARSDGVASRVSALVVRGTDGDGELLAVVFTHACGADTLRFHRVSGDWPGLVSTALEDRQAAVAGKAAGAVALCLAGCGADRRVPFDAGGIAGERSAAANSHVVALTAGLERALAGPLTAVAGPIDAQYEYLPGRYRAGEGVAELELPLQAWRFGDDLELVFLPGRAASSYASALREPSSGPTRWVTALANGAPGALPTSGGTPKTDTDAVAESEASREPRPRRWTDGLDVEIIARVRSLLSSGSDGLAGRVKPPPALSPEDALASFRLAAGLRIELVAAEPHLADPVAIAFDADGRLYACEMRDYPLGPGDGQPADGRVRRLEDRDGDGFFEHSAVFADEVAYANGIAPSRGGVYVAAHDSIVYLADRDGDGRAEARETVYSGFFKGNSQHLLNSLEWGLENWIHVNGGDGARIRVPSQPDRPELPLRYQNFRFRPADLAIERTSGYRGGFGIAFDARGHRFVCDNQNHAVQVVLPRRYLKRAPEVSVSSPMAVITAHGAEVHPVSKPLERFNDPFDVGRFSSACGVHVYGGDRLPQTYRGALFSCEPVSNLVHCDALVATGATFRAERIHDETEFLASTDYWFRPVNCATGPDGALYVVDMYREVIEHPQWIPQHVQELFNLRSGIDRGRIYRVVAAGPSSSPDSARSRPGPELGSASTAELIQGLSHPVSWWRRTAQRLLVERGAGSDAALVAGVREVQRRGADPLGRLHAMWVLEGLDRLTAADVAAALEDRDPGLREHGARFAERFATADGAADLGERVVALAGDADPLVRFQAALSLGSVPASARSAALLEIARADLGNRWTRTAVLLSLADDVPTFLGAFLGSMAPDDDDAEPAGFRDLTLDLVSLIGRRRENDELYQALDLLTRPGRGGRHSEWRVAAMSELLGVLGREGFEKLLAAAEPVSADRRGTRPMDRILESVDALFESLAARSRDATLELDERVRALELLAYREASGARSRLASFVDNRYPAELQVAAVHSLARVGGVNAVTGSVIPRFSTLTPRVRREIVDAVIQASPVALFESIERGELEAVDVPIDHRQFLLEHPDERLRRRAAKVFASIVASADRDDVVEKYRLALRELPGRADPQRGRTVFAERCSGCHRVGRIGVPVGPELTGLDRREADALLVDILDPNRAIDPRYLNYVVITARGEPVTGILVADNPGSVVLRAAEGKTHTVLRRDLRELRATRKSLMPEGLEGDIDPAAIRDLIAFLRREGG